MSFERPDTLSQVARLLVAGRSESVLKDFYHAFHVDPRPERLEEAPCLDGSRQRELLEAYLQAVAVYLASRNGWPPPDWTQRIVRAPNPYFASKGKAMRHLLLHQSPAPFRERDIFITPDAVEAV